MSKRLLTVGDGDLSFSLALVRAFDAEVTATTWLSAEELIQRYRSAQATKNELLQKGVPVLHKTDACNLQSLLDCGCVLPFDAAIFNFPHLGDVAADCHRPGSEHVRKHVALLSHFLSSSSLVAAEVHITLCGEQATLWNLHGSAQRLGWFESRRYAPADAVEFACGSLASLRRVPPEASWRCRRKWRNGSLGFVHWASQYGYEHRRHEGEQLMNISNCTTYVFTRHSLEANSANQMSGDLPGSNQCHICGQDFADQEALARHLKAPALPDSAAPSHACSHCSRVFLSQRALDQHHMSCGAAEMPKEIDGEASGYNYDLGTADLVSADLVVDTDGERFWHFARQSEAFRKHLPTKASVKRAIAVGELTLNGRSAEDSRILHRGDRIQLRFNKVREAQDSGAARARLVKVVSLPNDGPTACADSVLPEAGSPPWHVVRAICPPGAAVVWKPSGMRSRGKHAGTLEASLPLVPEFRSGALVPIPLSRLEIGCSGLSLVALTEKMYSELQKQLLLGSLYHVFRALVHGCVGSPGDIRKLDLRSATEVERGQSPKQPEDGSASSTSSDSEDEVAAEKNSSAKMQEVLLRVVSTEGGSAQDQLQPAAVSIVELSTAAASGRCCGSLCRLMRMNGTPVVGDMLARCKGARSKLRHRILGGDRLVGCFICWLVQLGGMVGWLQSWLVGFVSLGCEVRVFQDFGSRTLTEHWRPAASQMAEPTQNGLGAKMKSHETVLNLINTVVGCSVLSLPYAFSLTSYWTVLLLFLCVGVTAFTASLIGEELKMAERMQLCDQQPNGGRDYIDLAEIAFGRWGRGTVAVITLAEVWLTSVTGLVLNGSNLHSLLPITQAEAVLACTVVCSVMTFIPIRVYAYVSLISLVALLTASSCFMGELFTMPTSEWIFPETELKLDLGNLFRAYGLIIFCFAGHPCFPSLHESMQRTQRWKACVCWSFAIAAVFFLSMGLVPHLARGHEVHAVFTHDMSIPWLKVVTVAFIALKLGMSTPLFLRVVLSSLQIWPSCGNAKELIRTSLSVAAVFVVTGATACFLAKEVAELASLTGALLSNCASIIIPCMLYVPLSLRVSSWSQQSQMNKVKMVVCGVLMVAGMITTVGGSYMAVLDIST